jgi:cytochrome c5
MKRFLLRLLGAAIAALLLSANPTIAQAQAQGQKPAPKLGTEMGYEIFQKNCMMCHGNPDFLAHAPEVSAPRGPSSPEACSSPIRATRFSRE